MSYRIKIDYSTGDSFHHIDSQIEYVEGTWNNQSVVEENLKRIAQHYKYYYRLNKQRLNRFSEKEEKRYIATARKQPWFNTDGNWNGTDISQHVLNLKTDQGREYKYSSFWCGYFEGLNSVEIVLENPDWKITNFN